MSFWESLLAKRRWKRLRRDRIAAVVVGDRSMDCCAMRKPKRWKDIVCQTCCVILLVDLSEMMPMEVQGLGFEVRRDPVLAEQCVELRALL